MRHLKLVSQFSVMWVLVFVMAAGPLPLGIPRAEAGGPSVTDLPGLQNFFTPKVFIIFDTSRSMQFRPNDPNDDPSAAGDDWDPTNPTAECLNKFCIGKRALYRILPKYTPRVEMGLSGYNQYYQLTTQPSTLGTRCNYDRLAYNYTTWGKYFFGPTLEDIDPAATGLTGPLQDPSTAFQATPLKLTDPHSTIKWSVSGAGPSGGDQLYKNVGPTPGGSGSQMTLVLAAGAASPGGAYSYSGGTFTYNWVKTIPGGGVTLPDTGSGCALVINNYGGGACAGDPCTLNYTVDSYQTLSAFNSGTDLGATGVWNYVTYDRSGPVTDTIQDWCGQSSPYSGGGGSPACSNVQNGCTLTQIGSVPKFFGGIQKYYEASYDPGSPWTSLGPTTETYDVQIQAAGATCPSPGDTISTTQGPVEWRNLATGGFGPGIAGPSTNCGTGPGTTCTWTYLTDYFKNVGVTGETQNHYCTFQRTVYQWQQTANWCTYTAPVWTYTPEAQQHLCNYKFDRDVYAHDEYTWSYLPNDGDLLGSTTWDFPGNDDLGNYPTPVTYSNGQFSNGDCPNLAPVDPTHPECSGGVVCKLLWTANTTWAPYGNFPRGRYTGITGGPWWYPATPVVPYKSAEPVAELANKNFPADPFSYVGNWAAKTGARDEYWVTLMANYYDPTAVNPPSPPDFKAGCSNCTYQYSYVEPAGLLLNPGYQVQDPTRVLAPAAFNLVDATASLPSTRVSGWGQLPDQMTKAISWEGLAANNALPGGVLLKMLSKYDQVANPTGLQMPDFGDYTPLTGSLKNVADYLKTYIDKDPFAGCGRKYFVLLLTDGEEQPDNIPSNDPVGAVTALRNLVSVGGIHVDVKTFVIGFGISSNQLNQMARAGGTAVNAGDPSKEDLTAGVAFSSLDETALFSSLEITFGKILRGQFTRSKPVVNVLGTEMYVGYLNVLQGLEWQGELDSIDIKSGNLPSLTKSNTSDSDFNYLWRYGQVINTQTTRNVYTSLDPNNGNRIWFDYSGCTGCVSASGFGHTNSALDQAALESQIDPTLAKETIAFLLNPGAISTPDGGVPLAPELFDDGITPKTSRASDIFHAIPAVVEGAAQATTWPDSTESSAYAAFRNDTTILNREKTVYIGANDGMLHAVRDLVDSTSGPVPVPLPGAGEERWGYVPNGLLGKLKNFRTGHDYGVDGSVGVADVCGPGFSTSPCTVKDGWRTLLVGALGKGGGGLYALDVTDPADPKVKWERINPVDSTSALTVPRFGETWGAPVIARTEISASKPWSVFVGGGLVPADDPTHPWGRVFWILDARTGMPVTDGVNTAKFTIPDDPLDPTVNGIASRPTLFRPGDGAVARRAYFTDVEGKIWRMDLTSTDISTWSPGTVPFFDPASGNGVCNTDVHGNLTPILDANTGAQVISGVGLTLPITGMPRPKIFNRPMAALDTTGALDVYVGTGDTDDPGALTGYGGYDYLYGIRDLGLPGCGSPLFVLRFSQYEKVLADPAFLNNVVFVTTYLPVSTPGHICEVGRGFLYSFDALTGQPVAALKDPFNSNLPTAKLDLGDVRNPQLGGGGIPSAPIIRGNKLYIANETDPSHPRQIDLVGSPLSVKVRGWQRVK